MLQVFPNYYHAFRCTADRCQHNCCIGWEIDIDPPTAAFYQQLPGPLGERLRANITGDPEPHFVLDAAERCPFLNPNNLCEIITHLGQEHLCDICYLHPRFHNEFNGRLESGLGLCCEAAGALILGQKEPVHLVYDGTPDDPRPLLVQRDRLMTLAQDRSLPIEQRLERMGTLPDDRISRWVDIFLSLERLEDRWTVLLHQAADVSPADLVCLAEHMKDRQTEYEQLAVYLLYRHYATAADERDAAARATLPLLVYRLLRHMAAAILAKRGDFTFADQVELARLFSAEIEYSDENISILLSHLQ